MSLPSIMLLALIATVIVVNIARERADSRALGRRLARVAVLVRSRRRLR